MSNEIVRSLSRINEPAPNLTADSPAMARHFSRRAYLSLL